MGQLFQESLRAAKNRQLLLEDQRHWLTERDNRCGTTADTAVWSCLLEMTKQRAAALAKVTAVSIGVSSPVQPPLTPDLPATPTAQAQPSSNQSIQQTSLSATPVSQIDRSTGTPSRDSSSTSVILLTISALGLVACLKLVRNIRRNQRLAAERQHVEELRLAEEHRLVTRYGQEIAARILAREVWQGMTDEQLVESRGNPSDIGREIIREKTRETWKYHQIGRNRFRERIYLENRVVIGWKN